MNEKDLGTNVHNDWCPGCGNFAILNAVKSVLGELKSEGLPLEKVVLVSGIGQHAKMVDYLNVNSFYSLHGRVTPAASGIKIAKPELQVIGFAGDGDAYGEGIEHLIFAAKRNIDITMLIHDNRVYALTTGQSTPTSPLGFKGRSTPAGTREAPLNPLKLILASGATFIARSYTGKIAHLKKTIKEAILHKGFSLVDILQVCVTFNNLYEYYNQRVYEISGHDHYDYDRALKIISEWDYNADAPIALGTFYIRDALTLEEFYQHLPNLSEAERQQGIADLLKTYS